MINIINKYNKLLWFKLTRPQSGEVDGAGRCWSLESNLNLCLGFLSLSDSCYKMFRSFLGKGKVWVKFDQTKTELNILEKGCWSKDLMVEGCEGDGEGGATGEPWHLVSGGGGWESGEEKFVGVCLFLQVGGLLTSNKISRHKRL